MTNVTARFAGFAHAAAELSAYARTIDVFVIALRTGQIVQHTPPDAAEFEAWLHTHHIRNIDKDWRR
ncbi:MAG: hypothetical protein R2800_04480 [Flavipsychrobacter sp.]